MSPSRDPTASAYASDAQVLAQVRNGVRVCVRVRMFERKSERDMCACAQLHRPHVHPSHASRCTHAIET